MHKVSEKFRRKSRTHHDFLEISPTTLYRYRKHRGVNLGSWFVLERWIADTPFRFASHPAQSDLDIARGKNAREVLEAHWDTWVTEDDWAWIADRGFNSVRIPIGYYHLCGYEPSVLANTSFRDFQSVFSGAWQRIIGAIEAASRYGLGVLIDLHAAPGKQNRDPHAGTPYPPEFFSNKQSRDLTTEVLCVLLKALKSHALSSSPPLSNVIGIELVNEPEPSHDEILKSWYTSAIKALRDIDPTMPLYLGECWNPDGYAELVEKVSSPTSLVALDHHLYRCFTASDISTPVHEHIRRLSDSSAATPQTFARVTEKLGRAGGGLVVGEWSGGLNSGSLTGVPHEQATFVRTQLALYEQHCAGWFFWTYKKQWNGDTGWSLRDAVSNGVFPERVGICRRRGVTVDLEARTRSRDLEKERHWANHKRYWASYPGKYEHWRFADGFLKGWEASCAFLDSTNPSSCITELGFKGAWAKQTTTDFGKGYWEYEHGFLQGADAAKRDYCRQCCQ